MAGRLRDDWLDRPQHLGVIELRKEYGQGTNVWVQPSAAGYQEELRKNTLVEWSVASGARKGDLVVFYLKNPLKEFGFIGRLQEDARKIKAVWKRGKDTMAKLRIIARLRTPVHLDELKRDRVLKNSTMLTGALRGRPCITEHWPFLRDMIARRNPKLRRMLREL